MMRYAALFVSAILLSACAALPPLPGLAVATRTPAVISRAQAIDLAVKAASMAQPEITEALVTPTNLQAGQMTLGQAMQRIQAGRAVPSGYSADMPVWYVTMDGRWDVGIPGPEITPAPYHHYIVVLDAFSGAELDFSPRP